MPKHHSVKAPETPATFGAVYKLPYNKYERLLKVQALL
jgi:hypothetical protein